jgi:secreted trypsin-like serine protease
MTGGGDPAAAATGLRVIGGASVAGITSFPFQVALYIHAPGGLLNPAGSLSFCGGVIVDPTQVLTAAHCVVSEVSGQPVAPAAVAVLAGTATLPLIAPYQPVAAAIAVDPRYDPSTADYDVAVVTVPAPLYAGTPRADGTSVSAPIALITPALADRYANPELTPAEPVVISGWGETGPVGVGAHDNNSTLPQQLQAAQTHLVPDATCTAEYAGLGSIGVPSITTRMLCAGEPSGGIDACAGDSGGPLVVDVNSPATPPSDYVLAGLIDFGAGCAQAGYPGVYVRLATPDIEAFVAQQAQTAGQQLLTPPVPVGTTPPRRVLGTAGTASLAGRTARVRARVVRVPIRCTAARCTGTLVLRTTTTVGTAHFTIAADTTARIPLRVTPTGQRQLDRHQHRLRTRATLRTSGSPATQQAFTITD